MGGSQYDRSCTTLVQRLMNTSCAAVGIACWSEVRADASHVVAATASGTEHSHLRHQDGTGILSRNQSILRSDWDPTMLDLIWDAGLWNSAISSQVACARSHTLERWSLLVPPTRSCFYCVVYGRVVASSQRLHAVHRLGSSRRCRPLVLCSACVVQTFRQG